MRMQYGAYFLFLTLVQSAWGISVCSFHNDYNESTWIRAQLRDIAQAHPQYAERCQALLCAHTTQLRWDVDVKKNSRLMHVSDALDVICQVNPRSIVPLKAVLAFEQLCEFIFAVKVLCANGGPTARQCGVAVHLRCDLSLLRKQTMGVWYAHTACERVVQDVLKGKLYKPDKACEADASFQELEAYPNALLPPMLSRHDVHVCQDHFMMSPHWYGVDEHFFKKGVLDLAKLQHKDFCQRYTNGIPRVMSAMANFSQFSTAVTDIDNVVPPAVRRLLKPCDVQKLEVILGSHPMTSMDKKILAPWVESILYKMFLDGRSCTDLRSLKVVRSNGGRLEVGNFDREMTLIVPEGDVFVQMMQAATVLGEGLFHSKWGDRLLRTQQFDFDKQLWGAVTLHRLHWMLFMYTHGRLAREVARSYLTYLMATMRHAMRYCEYSRLEFQGERPCGQCYHGRAFLVHAMVFVKVYRCGGRDFAKKCMPALEANEPWDNEACHLTEHDHKEFAETFVNLMQFYIPSFIKDWDQDCEGILKYGSNEHPYSFQKDLEGVMAHWGIKR